MAQSSTLLIKRKQRDDHQRAHGCVAKRSEDRLAQCCNREIFFCDAGDAEHVKQRGIDQQVDRAQEENSVQHGARHLASGIADLVAEINGAVPSVEGVDDRLAGRERRRKAAAIRKESR